MTKLAFFDVDGTLSVPVFPDGDRLGIGLTNDAWLDYCIANPENGYHLCRPVPAAREYARKLLDNGARCYVLTTSTFSYETSAKEVFIQKHYPGLFEQVIAVSSNSLKIPVILAMARHAGLDPDCCELIEDTYTILLEADRQGIKATHIVSITA
ncbi:MAG: hypothetical protein IJ242_08980 [Clostridia bacterium]|nr:hypothetical protein [Clostridia bacterium]